MYARQETGNLHICILMMQHSAHMQERGEMVPKPQPTQNPEVFTKSTVRLRAELYSYQTDCTSAMVPTDWVHDTSSQKDTPASRVSQLLPSLLYTWSVLRAVVESPQQELLMWRWPAHTCVPYAAYTNGSKTCPTRHDIHACNA